MKGALYVQVVTLTSHKAELKVQSAHQHTETCVTPASQQTPNNMTAMHMKQEQLKIQGDLL